MIRHFIEHKKIYLRVFLLFFIDNKNINKLIYSRLEKNKITFVAYYK